MAAASSLLLLLNGFLYTYSGSLQYADIFIRASELSGGEDNFPSSSAEE